MEAQAIPTILMDRYNIGRIGNIIHGEEPYPTYEQTKSMGHLATKLTHPKRKGKRKYTGNQVEHS